MGGLFGGGGPSAPGPPPPPPPAPQLPQTQQSDAVKEQQRRAAMAGGMNSTIITGPEGLTKQADTTQKQLLGQ